MFDYFDCKMVLNVPSAAERLRRTVNHLQQVGISDYTVFSALPDETPHRSFNRSMNGILNAFLKTDKQRLLILEDDVVFSDDAEGILKAARLQLPTEWDILYLGANLHVGGFKEPIRYSKNLARIYNAWTTHAIAFNRKCVKWLAYNQPQFHEGMFDGWLSDQLFHFNAFCISPMIAYQHSGESLIWGNRVDYTPVFDESNKILLNLK